MARNGDAAWTQSPADRGLSISDGSGSELNRVEVQNCNGSVEHYFHFLLGFCVPLVRFQLSGQRQDKEIPLAVRECGPLTALIYELGLNLQPQPPEQFRQSRGAAPVAVLSGYDAVVRYDRPVFEEFSSYIGTLPSQPAWPSMKGTVVLIERGPAPAFYMSERAEIQGAAASRRAIGNHEELRTALARALPRFENVTLEESTLLQNFVTFHSADIVVAQHGAALANIVFMREGSHVIDIVPIQEGPGLRRDTFSELARTMGVGYTMVDQDGSFAPVNPLLVLEAISTVPSSTR